MRQLLKTTLLIIAICFTAFAAAAQQPALSGTVVDAAGGGPIQFATVAVRPVVQAAYIKLENRSGGFELRSRPTIP